MNERNITIPAGGMYQEWSCLMDLVEEDTAKTLEQLAIQEKLADNGSLRATFETTEDRLTFLIHIPIHAGCGNKPATEKTTVITTEKNAIGSEKNGSGSEKSSEKNQAIISAIRLNPKVTAAEIAMKLGVSLRAVEKRIKTLRENGIIRRIGGDKGGYWEVIENGIEQ